MWKLLNVFRKVKPISSGCLKLSALHFVSINHTNTLRV